MRKTNFLERESYDAPFVEVINAQAESVLASSPQYGDDNEAGRIMEESEDATWNF